MVVVMLDIDPNFKAKIWLINDLPIVFSRPVIVVSKKLQIFTSALSKISMVNSPLCNVHKSY